MSHNWVVFLVAMWIIGSLVCLICEGAWIGSDEASVLESLMTAELFTADSVIGKIAGAFSGEIWSALLDMASWNYGIFYGTWELIRWIFLMPLTIAVFYATVLQTARLVRGGG